MNLNKVFKPQSIVVIGASRKKGKLGYDLLANVSQNYKGKVYAVNPKGGKVLGHKLYKQVSDLPRKVDLALVIVPAKIVEIVVREAADHGIKNFVIVSAGFKEIGGQGKQREEDLKRLAQEKRLNIVGPNCLGYINNEINLNASFGPSLGIKGGISLISQSGAMAVAILDLATKEKLGLQMMISIGNKMQVTELEALKYLAQDKKTEVIAMYLESLAEPQEFLKLASKVVKKKPVVILKAGISRKGQQAASSHTGSLAQSDKIIEAAFKQAGIIRVKTIRELFQTADNLTRKNTITGPNTVIVSNAGGPAIIATDALSNTNLTLVKVPSKLQKDLRKDLPEASPVTNPIDVLGDADLKRFKVTLRKIQKSKDIDNTLLIVTPQTMTPVVKLAGYVAGDESLVSSFIGGSKTSRAMEMLHKKAAAFSFPEDAVKFLNFLLIKKQANGFSFLENSYSARRKLLLPSETQKILKKNNFNIMPGKLLTNKKALRNISTYPIALKVVSSDIIHKASSSAVTLDIYDTREALSAWQTMYLKARKEKAKVDGMWVQKMAKKGKELFIGAYRDKQFGVVIMAGIGGTAVNDIDDVVMRLGKVDKAMAASMVKEIKNQDKLKDINKGYFIKTIAQVSDLMEDRTDIQELDINPIVMYKNRGVIVDARIFTSHV